MPHDRAPAPRRVLALLCATAVIAIAVAIPSAGAATNAALSFSGDKQRVTFGPAPGLGASTFTIELWFRRTGAGVPTTTGPNGLPDAIPLLTKGRAQNDGSVNDVNYFLGIDASSGVLVADFEQGPGSTGKLGTNFPLSGSTVVSSDVWHHAAATYDGSTLRLYLDGVLDASRTVNKPPRSDSAQHAALGSALNSTGGAQGFFAGVLDEARVWNVARSAAQIEATREVAITSPMAGLLARWGLDEGAGAVVGDSIGSHDGTRKAGPPWVTGAPALDEPPDPPDDGAFTLMVVPDPQKYTSNATLSATYRAQMEWIVGSTDDLNTVFTVSVGDLVQNVSSATHWQRADAAWSILDAAGTPYSVVPGNHDMTSTGVATLYDSTFPVSRQAGLPTYGGYLGDPTDGIPDPANRQNKDSYHLFSAGGMDFLAISIEMDLPRYAIDWVQDVIDAFPNRRVILVTHRWLWEDGTRWDRSFWRTDTPVLSPEEVWDELVYPNCQVFMVVNGHEHAENRRTDANACGDPVFQLLADYQALPNGGDGWLRYYTFEPAQDEIEAYTYSVTRNGGNGEFENDANSRFTLDWDMPAP